MRFIKRRGNGKEIKKPWYITWGVTIFENTSINGHKAILEPEDSEEIFDIIEGLDKGKHFSLKITYVHSQWSYHHLDSNLETPFDAYHTSKTHKK